MTYSPAIVLTGGDPAPVSVGPLLPRDALVIAADSGIAAADRLGLTVDLIVGDLDSADPATVEAARASGAVIERHPVDKDATDLELALEAAARRGCRPIVVVGGASFDRIDHFMANALLLAVPRFASLQPRWYVKSAQVAPVHDRIAIHGVPGDIVTLLPLGGIARGVVTEGLRWELDGDDLEAGSTRGVSNEMTGSDAIVSVLSGTLLAIHTGGTR
ncbi:thiamine diphosphokinase [bacterium]|nr:thiamine diphosphokinase [bacterium]